MAEGRKTIQRLKKQVSGSVEENMRKEKKQVKIKECPRAKGGCKRQTTHECTVGETEVERQDALEVLDVPVLKRNVEGFNVGHEMLDLATTNDGEDVWGLLHDVGDGNCIASSFSL